MREKVLNFIKYNNAFTIIVVIFLFSFGISFAVNPDARDSVYASEETVIAVDNSLIVSIDLDNFNFNLRINSVTDDEKNYYAVYSYQTLVIENSIWQSKKIEKILTISKEALGEKDLGLYIAQELGENINYELFYLKKVQKLEKEKGESPKVVTVEYSGLIGKLLDPKEKVIEGYDPVIPEPVPEIPATVESNPEEVIVSTPYIESKQETESVPSSTLSTPSNSTNSSESDMETATNLEAAAGQAEIVPDLPINETETTSEATSTPPEPEPEATSTPVEEIESITSVEATSTPPEPEPEPSHEPTPEEMVDEELIKEVVEELLQDEATSTPTQ